MADRDDRNALEERGPRPQLLGAVVVAALIVTFVVQNTNKVTIHFLWFAKDASVWVALLITAVLAIVAGELFGHVVRRQRRRR